MKTIPLSEALTIIVPLRGRPEYTKRFLGYANWIKCPFKILLGDGGDDNLQLNEKDYPNIRYEYIKYPYDKDIITFNSKMNNLVSKVETPLMMWIDNDDLFCLEGIYKLIFFLYKNKDFYGGIGGLKTFTMNCGRPEINEKYLYNNPSIIGDSAVDRVINSITYFHSHVHDTVRTGILQIAYDIIDNINTNDFKLSTRADVFVPMAYGKSYRDNEIVYFLHETRTPRTFDNSLLPCDAEWVQKEYWNESFSKLISIVGVVISYIDNIEIYKAKKIFLEAYIKKLINVIVRDNHPFASRSCKILEKSADVCFDISNQLGIDDKIRNCLLKKRIDLDFNLADMENPGISWNDFIENVKKIHLIGV